MQVSVSSYVLYTSLGWIVAVKPVGCRGGGSGWGRRGQHSKLCVGRTVSHGEEDTDALMCVWYFPAKIRHLPKSVARVLRSSSVSAAQRTQTGDKHLYINSARFIHVPR